MSDKAAARTFGADVGFLKEHTEVLVLKDGDIRVALAPAYQGRVMTSTTGGEDGPSFGYLNDGVIAQGGLSPEARPGTLQDHVHVFGGEERFWMGPEGGQYAIFFAPGAPFEFDAWHTPSSIDTEAFTVKRADHHHAVFTHEAQLVNHSGTRFQVGIQRIIRLLQNEAVATRLRGALPARVTCVGYTSDNRITNIGDTAWTPASGLLSIWLLGMYKPGPRTVVAIPFKYGDEEELGPAFNDAYFGRIPSDYLKAEDGVLFLRADGTRRGKIGIRPTRSLGVAGSYDPDLNVLTIVTYEQPQAVEHGYVNSMWELQDKPYDGDAINAYNDGSPGPGLPPLGPFYEIETSSPAAALQPGATMRHEQCTLHIEGAPPQLDPLTQRILGVSLDDMLTVFK